MPSLYKLIDAMSDMVISVVYTSGSDSHNSEPSTTAESEPGNNNRSSSRSSYHCNIKYNGKDNGRCPTHQDQLPYPPSKRRPTIPYSKTRVRGTHSEYLAPKRFMKTPPTTKNVHWSNMMEVDGEAYRFTAPALNSYPLRRRRKANYVYGADGGDSNNNVYNTEDRDSSPEPQEPYSAAASYEEQQYPDDRYSRTRSRSGSRNHSPAGNYPGSDGGRSQSRSPDPREASRPDMPRSILKPPTATDDEMLLRNTWGIIARQEQQINYMYEFLSDVLLVGHDVLDCMFETGEISMCEETTRRAQQAQQAQQARGRGSRASSPIPRQQRFEDESQGQTQYPAPYPGQSPTLSSSPRRAFEGELKRREARQSPPEVYSPVLGPRGSQTDPWLDAQRSSLGEDSREASPVPGERPSSSPRFDGRPELLYGREGAMSRQEETRSPAPGVRGIDTIYEDPEEQ